MAGEYISVPPIVEQVVGEHKMRLGVAVQAYHYLWQITVCGKNGGLRSEFNQWVSGEGHDWLEADPGDGGQTPLVRLRIAIEKEKRKLLEKDLDPCEAITVYEEGD